MYLAGIDPSLTRTAVCLGNETDFEVYVGGTDAAGHDLRRRFARYEDLLDQTLTRLEEVGPSFIFLEGYSYGSAGRAGVSLGEYGGCLRKRLLATGGEVIEVAPQSLKKFGSGKAGSKSLYIGSIARDYNVSFPDEDEYFAYGLYRMALVYTRREKPRNPAQMEVIEQIRNTDA